MSIWFLLEPGTELATTTTRYFTPDIRRQPGEVFAESQDLIDHIHDGFWWFHRSPFVQDGIATKSVENS